MSLDLEAIRARRERTWEEMAKLCKNPLAWRMCIPVNEDDSDRVITATCRDIDVLIAEVEQLQSRLVLMRVFHQQLSGVLQNMALALDPPSLVEAFKELRAAVGGAYDGVDVEAFVRALRGDEDEP